MKKMLIIILVLALTLSFAAAAEKTGQGKGQNTTGSQAANATQAQAPAATEAQAVAEKVRAQEQAWEEAQQTMGEEERATHQEQHEVRAAVFALHELGKVAGGIGPNISEVASGFNNSVQATIRAQERIEQRSALARFFAGGDEEAARDILEEVDKNQERLERLARLRESCSCEEGIKEMMLEQERSLAQEQERLRGLAQNETKSKGLLGWIWK